MGAADVAERTSIRRTKWAPTTDVRAVAVPGSYREERLPDGRTTSRATVALRDRDGNLTQAAHHLQDMMLRGLRAETERGYRLAARRSQVVMQAPSGQVVSIDSEIAEFHGRTRGFRELRHRRRHVRYEKGPDGMLFRLERDEWCPTGRSCLGTPYFGGDPVLAVKGIQRDPWGRPWRGVGGQWVLMLEEES